MEKTSKPKVAGILNIVLGSIEIFLAILYFIGFTVVGGAWNIPGMSAIPHFVPGIVLGTAIFTLILGILVLIGGIFAVQRKQWGWALTGSIAAILTFLPLGIATTVLVAVSRDEFE